MVYLADLVSLSYILELYLEAWCGYSFSSQHDRVFYLFGLYFGLGMAALLILVTACAYFMLCMSPRACASFHETLVDTIMV